MGRRATPHVTGAYDGANFRAWNDRSRATPGVDCLGCPGTRRCSGLADQPGRITAGIATTLWDSPSRQRHTAARMSCSSLRCRGGQPGDCGPDTNGLAVHEQRPDRKMRQDRGEQHGDCVRLGAESQWRTGDGNTMSGRCVCRDRFRGSQSRSVRSAVKARPKASICSIEVSSSATRSTCGLPPSSCRAIKRRPSRLGPRMSTGPRWGE